MFESAEDVVHFDDNLPDDGPVLVADSCQRLKLVSLTVDLTNNIN